MRKILGFDIGKPGADKTAIVWGEITPEGDIIVEEIQTIEGTAPWDFITTDGAKE